MQRRDVCDHASVGRDRGSDDDDRIERRAFERGTVRQREQRSVARAADRLALEPPVAERALVVRAPRLERDVAALDPGDDEREPFGGRFAQLAVREVGGAEIGACPPLTVTRPSGRAGAAVRGTPSR